MTSPPAPFSGTNSQNQFIAPLVGPNSTGWLRELHPGRVDEFSGEVRQ